MDKVAPGRDLLRSTVHGYFYSYITNQLNYHSVRLRTLGWSHGLVVRTLDSESSNPSSNLGGTLIFTFRFIFLIY